MPRYKIEIQYDGTHYSGWQIQPNALSIQEKIEQTLYIFLRQQIKLVGAGRTDTGVHALGQIAHFDYEKELESFRFIYAANSLLPPDIRILSCEKVSSDFHAQYCAQGKIYHYFFNFKPVQLPFHRQYALHIPHAVNLDKLIQAKEFLIGTHDFTSFANSKMEGSVSKDPVRTIFRIDLIEEEGMHRLEFFGNGFLYKMVRNMVGTLLEVADGKREPQDIKTILEKKDRKLAGKAAPPHGLFMIKVLYA